MSASLIIGALWVVASTIVAMLPMRLQYVPGLSLLLAAPFLISFIGYQHGVWIAVVGVLGFVSMFRNPLKYIWKRLREKYSGEPQ
ncbi:MAG: DUF2484 family protein [Litoreibacter sp.]